MFASPSSPRGLPPNWCWASSDPSPSQPDLVLVVYLENAANATMSPGRVAGSTERRKAALPPGHDPAPHGIHFFSGAIPNRSRDLADLAVEPRLFIEGQHLAPPPQWTQRPRI